MTQTIRYGRSGIVQFELSTDRLLARCGPEQRPDDYDPRAIVDRALTEPPQFPPLSQAVVPGDRVVIALEPGMPEVATVVASIVAILTSAGVAATDITILRTRADTETSTAVISNVETHPGVDASDTDPRCLLPADLRTAVHLATHDPDVRGDLAYLTNTLKGRPIYLSRAICDADLTISVGLLRCRESTSYYGIQTPVYPTFSDADALRRFRKPELLQHQEEVVQLAWREVERVGWLSGVAFALRLLPGADGSLLAAYAGNTEFFDQAAHEQCSAAWQIVAPSRAALVVATLTGNANEQTWDNVARALASARRVVKFGGAIVLCTEVAAGPGMALQSLVDADDYDRALRKPREERPLDLWPALELALALENGRVYLLSRLDETTVEELGITPIGDPADLGRLIGRADSCIILDGAQHLQVHVENDE